MLIPLPSRYYSGEKEAPILTLFIGGNHEASNYLQELPYGGWVAKNIYYMGYAGVVNVNGLRIGGISGIFKHFDYQKGHHECPPYSEDTKRSVYHVRQFDVWRMKHLSGNLDICISHDWPRGIYHHGDTRELVRSKPFFAGEIESNSLGSRANEELLNYLKPSYWFSAHLHCKFAAVVEHKGGQTTKFLALDKCLPKRKFLHIVDVGEKLAEDEKPTLHHDLEWLTVLHLTNHLISVKASANYLPNKDSVEERGNFTPTEEELAAVRTRLSDDLKVKENFQRTATPHNPLENQQHGRFNHTPYEPVSNPQTRILCDLLNIDDPLQLVLAMSGRRFAEYSATQDSTEAPQDDRDVVIEEERIVERTRTSLSLPAPKGDEGDSANEEAAQQNPEEISLSDDDNAEPQVEEMAAATVDEPVEGEKVETEAAVEKPEETATPPVKKFKRRNESIYKANSDEEEQK